MKRIIYIFLIALCCILSGCTSKANQLDSNTDTPNSEIGVLNYYMLIGKSNENGMYYRKVGANGVQNIKYVDFKTHTDIFFCNRAECTHSDETCTSYLSPYAGTASPTPYGDKLYVIYYGWYGNYYYDRYGNEALARIEVMDLNGENRRVVRRFKPSESFTGHCAFGENEIYMIMETVEENNGETVKKTYLKCYDIETGDEILSDELDLIAPEIVARNGEKRELYIENVDWNDKMESLSQIGTVVSKYNLDTKELATVFATPSRCPSRYYNNYSCVINTNEKTLTKYNLTTGESTLLCEDLRPGYDVGGIETATNDGVLFYYYEDEDGEDVVLDFFSFEYNKPMNIHIPTTSFTQYGDIEMNGAPSIAAETDDEYLIVVNEFLDTASYYDTQGNLVGLPGKQYRMAFISKENYMNSVPEYTYVDEMQ